MAETTVPHQLPADVSGFTGRVDQLDELDAMLLTMGGRSSAVGISAIGGTAGVGKTALAVHWAHRVADRFPGGQLYVNLRGYDLDQPMTAAAALARFLAALGVPRQCIPVEVDERAARYRTELTGRQMLIVLDNAATAEQVRPLLPGAPSCAVVVTSRDSLAGLVAVDGARRIDLDLLPVDEAVTLLHALIGDRVDAEPAAAPALAEQCARLPLALRIAAELAVSRPATRLADLVAELADQHRRLDVLAAGGDPRAAVTAVFSWSIRHLPPEVARTFGLLGLHPGPDFDALVAAALADTGLDAARRELEQLARAHLVYPIGPGRYGMHDLLRAYATSLVTAEDGDSGGRAASTRLFDYYLATAAIAMDRLHPADMRNRTHIPPADTPTPDLPDPETARQWLDTERHALVAVVAHTATHGWPTHTTRLSATLYHYLDGSDYAEALFIHNHARHAAERAGDHAGQAQALLGVGTAHIRLGRYPPAADHFNHALALFRQTGDRIGEARALGSIGLVEVLLGRYQSATDHLRNAATLFRQTGDRTGEAHTLNVLGVLSTRRGRYELAANHLRHALTLFRRTGDRIREADMLSNLAFVEVRLGQHRSAADHLKQALALYRRLGHLRGEAAPLDNIGVLYIRLRQADQAIEHLQQALTLFRESGDLDGQTSVFNGLGEAAHAAGCPADALTHHKIAHAIATDTGERHQQARTHSGLGHAHHALGDLARAREHYEQALAIYTDLGSTEADDARAHLDALTPLASGPPA